MTKNKVIQIELRLRDITNFQDVKLKSIVDGLEGIDEAPQEDDAVEIDSYDEAFGI